MRFGSLAAHALVLSLSATTVFAAGCTGGSDDASVADGEDQEVRATSSLIGNYVGTKGPFAGLTLDRGPHGKQTYTGKQQVTCVRAPCNPIDVSGTWSTRAVQSNYQSVYGTLKLTPATGAATTYTFTYWSEGSLVLEDEKLNIVAELYKEVPVAPASAKLGKALQDRGIPGLDLAIDPASAGRQQRAHPGKVGYEDAAILAIDELLTSDFDGPLMLVDNAIENDWIEGACAVNKDAKRALVCLLNQDGAVLTLEHEGFSTPHGDDTSASWIFTLGGVDAFGDHGVYAVVDRQTKSVSVYTFN